jgi:hypothetical protein
MGKFKSDTARHRDPRKQLADPLGPAARPGPTKGRGVASSVIATADVGAVGLCSGADPPPGSWGTRHRYPAIMPGRGVDENPGLGAGRARPVLVARSSCLAIPLPCPTIGLSYSVRSSVQGGKFRSRISFATVLSFFPRWKASMRSRKRTSSVR